MFNFFTRKLTPEQLNQEDRWLRLMHKARDWPVERLTLGQLATLLAMREYTESSLRLLESIEEKLKSP